MNDDLIHLLDRALARGARAAVTGAEEACGVGHNVRRLDDWHRPA